MNTEEKRVFNEFILERKRQAECIRTTPNKSLNGFIWNWYCKVKINNPVIIKDRIFTFAKVELNGEIKFVHTSSFFDRFSNNQELIGEYELERVTSVCGVLYTLIPQDLNWRLK